MREAEPAAQVGRPSGGHFLRGPVPMRPAVRAAFAREAVSHRAEGVPNRLRIAQRLLCALTGAHHATLLLGSGTLANDVIGSQLHQRGGRGVVCSNGEFGERLVDQATRLGLVFDVVRVPWGDVLEGDVIDRAMRATSGRWLWAAHTETSTGVVNALDALRAIAARHEAVLALDAISSVGGIPVDLTGVWCASTVSGKALAAYPGLAIVLHADQPTPMPTGIPRYLDLGLAAAHDSVPFTQSSNLIDALATSLEHTDWATRLADRTHDGCWLRDALEMAGFHVVAPRESASPVVHTLALPDDTPTTIMGEALRQHGWFVSFESGYLRQRNWLQLCLMGEYDAAALHALPGVLREAADAARRATAPAAASMDVSAPR
jgi:aspartate aminotransferase-like enzyme